MTPRPLESTHRDKTLEPSGSCAGRYMWRGRAGGNSEYDWGRKEHHGLSHQQSQPDTAQLLLPHSF